jgi:hypothetical protein
LVARGISYVSENINSHNNDIHSRYNYACCWNLSSYMCNVVYAPKDVIDTYISYNKNQEIYIKKFKTENETLTKDVIDSLEFNKLSRPIDRKALELKMKFKKETLTKQNVL